ncbi:MAG TPA: phytanoyl-CoA dioxygenase family protein [Abditibacteriaceae bacterium]|jgi:ectoine hydroxylase-related dioxygenase (phytanoyl-CoA dioxygenase family)
MISTLPQLSSCGQELDTSPEAFGELRDSSDVAHDFNALRERMAEDGYLYVPGYLNRAEVLEARHHIVTRLAADGHIDTSHPIMDAVATPGTGVNFEPHLANNNEALMKVLYDGPMMEFYAGFLGEEVLHFDFTWLRAVAPGAGTPAHLDVVYMGRGTKNLFTAWTTLGDTPLDLGGLMILENSHRQERIKNGYGTKDVDAFCENRVGSDYTGMGGGGNISHGGWLSKNPRKLRENLGGRWLTAPEFRAGDLLTFSMFTIHASLDNKSDRIRISSDSRYQRASEPADERWIGPNPIGHGPAGKRAMIC